MKAVRATAAVLCAAAVFLAGCQDETEPVPTAPRPVVSENVKGPNGFGRTFLGEVSSRKEADLAFPVPGTLAERPVDAGALVTAGAVLAMLDPSEFESSVRIAEAALVVARARLKTATDARERTRTLVDRGVDSAQDLERADQNVAAARAAVDQADADGVDARKTLEDATLRAPQDGVVSMVYQEPGAAVTAGQPILRLSGTDDREVLIDMTDAQLARFSEGDAFVLVLDANRDVVARGVLASVDPVLESATRTRRVHLRIDAPPVGFRLGALVRVTAARAGAGDVSVPQTALRDDGTVWRVERPAGIVRSVPVQTGETFAGRVLIRDGISEGDEIVVKGVGMLSEGQAVGRQVAQ
ncbi:efflux RND transporter periplasmic adaptor subunit [Oceaniglobus indicus]|uniref:efflux RND transporter periplasmic adaptor subunit n=1 Tax=Oceaniglobus indicus TaxID=2047749 RepID=UPI000C17F738|nr:efflux RND transporter periplasmic adaptor subunit [Oceaniglobus indicus]